ELNRAPILSILLSDSINQKIPTRRPFLLFQLSSCGEIIKYEKYKIKIDSFLLLVLSYSEGMNLIKHIL
ncbi:MAG: hypothetical protein WAM95_17725, partial [Bacillus sp. (in: firmicutes)]